MLGEIFCGCGIGFERDWFVCVGVVGMCDCIAGGWLCLECCGYLVVFHVVIWVEEKYGSMERCMG